MKLKPVLFNILIEMDPINEDKFKKSGDLYIPENIAQKNIDRAASMVEIATVVEVGPASYKSYDHDVRPQITKGSRVMITLHCGQQKTIDGRAFRIIRDDDVLAVVLEEDKQ